MIPVSGNCHWSLLVIELTQGSKVAFYHINSLEGAHSSDSVFGLAKTFMLQI
jgi:Ulp1 family protease